MIGSLTCMAEGVNVRAWIQSCRLIQPDALSNDRWFHLQVMKTRQKLSTGVPEDRKEKSQESFRLGESKWDSEPKPRKAVLHPEIDCKEHNLGEAQTASGCSRDSERFHLLT